MHSGRRVYCQCLAVLNKLFFPLTILIVEEMVQRRMVSVALTQSSMKRHKSCVKAAIFFSPIILIVKEVEHRRRKVSGPNPVQHEKEQGSCEGDEFSRTKSL